MSKRNQPPAVPRSLDQYFRWRSVDSKVEEGPAGRPASARRAAMGADIRSSAVCRAPPPCPPRPSPMHGTRRRPGRAPRARASLQARPGSAPPEPVAGTPKTARRAHDTRGAARLATPCIEKTSDAFRPRSALLDDLPAEVRERSAKRRVVSTAACLSAVLCACASTAVCV